MNPTRESVLEVAMNLSEEDRAALVEALLASLSPDDEVTDEDAFVAELEARWADFERSREGTISWDELKRQE
jgi:putative addiction module component (TIGR02574 family)